MRDRIITYNVAHGIKTTKDSGYHETLTLFWVQIIIRYLRDNIGNNNIVLLTNGLINSYENPFLPLEYYSRDLLMSCQARISWVEPDLKPLKYLILWLKTYFTISRSLENIVTQLMPSKYRFTVIKNEVLVIL